MNPVRKRLKLGSDATDSSAASNDALLLLLPPPAAPGYGGAELGAEEEEEEEGYLLVEEDTTDSSLVITMEDSQKEVKAARRRVTRKRRRKLDDKGEEDEPSESEEDGEAGVVVEIDKQLDQSLETKSKQLNLTTVNVRNILHEVITNEHVVAMMKAAINETDAVPPFEPKMTRSKFKEVVEKGVVIPAWNISPIKKTSDINKAPQFVDIPLAEEDSSDEEYHPDEEEEDETAEDTFHESDMESTASSPRGSRLHRLDDSSCSPWQTSRIRSQRMRAKSVAMGPPPPPPSKAPLPKAVPDSTFLEKLHAVEEELAVCMEPFEPLPESGDEVGLMAYRTRSKRPLRDVPMGKLEAELRAPDITPDMYDSSSTHEDREWTDWLRGLMSSEVDNEEECDDEDDPEYNFLAEVDEPDQEDYRDDKAVRITKKEVNELMEELFETLKEDLAGQELEEAHEEEEEPQEEIHTMQIPTAEDKPILQSHNVEAVIEPITEVRTVKQQLALLRSRQKLGLPISQTYAPEPHTLKVDFQQRKKLQQQLQQHVQLLTQIHLLSAPVAKLHSEAETTRQFLFELDLLAQRGELLMSSCHPGFCSSFRASNLQAALQLLEELRQEPIEYLPHKHIADSRGKVRSFPVMPAEVSWLFATRPVFLYPELLPCASLDPALYCRRRTAAFTAAEDCLLVLGLRNMDGSRDPTKLVSQFLLRKTLVQVRRRILQCCRPGSPDNIVKAFRYQRVLWPMQVACRQMNAAECCPPVEREEGLMPLWLARSLPIIHSVIGGPSDSAPKARNTARCGRVRQSQLTLLRSVSSTYTFPNGLSYPSRLPSNLDFRRIGFCLLQPPTPAPDPPSPPFCDLKTSPISSGPPSPDADSPPPVPQEADITASTVSTTTREQISCHFRTLASLRRRTVSANSRKRSHVEVGGVSKPPTPAAPESPASSQMEERESDDVVTAGEEEEEEEEESEMQLFLSDSAPSSVASEHTPDLEEVESESEQEVTLTPSHRVEEDDHGGNSSDDLGDSVLQAKPSSEVPEEENEDEDQRESEDEAFARDYLLRVCNAVQLSPACAEQLLHTLEEFSSAGAPEDLYEKLSRVLQPWPQLLKDFAAFLNQDQAQRCGLLVEQQMFERSRRFLQRLGQSLGEDSSLYQQVVSVLQGTSTPLPEHTERISSLLKCHPDLQQELCEFFRQLQTESPLPNSTETIEKDVCISQSPAESDAPEEEMEQAVCAQNISMGSNGEKLVIWTREADRAILTACQQHGATHKTFHQVSTQLGNKTAQQVSLRFNDLMSLFHSAKKSTYCTSKGHQMGRQEAALD